MTLKLKKTGPIWGLIGFTLGALLAGAAAGVIGYPGTHVLSPDTIQISQINKDLSSPVTLSQRIILPIIKSDEIDAAINSLSKKEQHKIRDDMANDGYQLLWLTIWDWDTEAGEDGTTISIGTDETRRIVKLNSRRARTVIREPKSGYIEFRGETTDDGNISISLLSGTQPIALPIMQPGKIVRVPIGR
ncbi:MAG TPA: hypothetical protein VIK28_05175 [Sedimentisphaerales bacterium]